MTLVGGPLLITEPFLLPDLNSAEFWPGVERYPVMPRRILKRVVSLPDIGRKCVLSLNKMNLYPDNRHDNITLNVFLTYYLHWTPMRMYSTYCHEDSCRKKFDIPNLWYFGHYIKSITIFHGYRLLDCLALHERY